MEHVLKMIPREYCIKLAQRITFRNGLIAFLWDIELMKVLKK